MVIFVSNTNHMKKSLYLILSLNTLLLFSQQAADLDSSFGNNGFFYTDPNSDIDYSNCLTIMQNDQIVVAGGYDNFSVIKLMPDGTFDTSFGNQGQVIIPFDGFKSSVHNVIVRPDGKIILAGDVFVASGNYNFGIALLNADGTLDTSFNTSGKLVFNFEENINYLRSASLQSDGKIIVAGQCGTSSNADFAIARINPDGTFDTTFGIQGKQRIEIQSDDRGRCVAIQSDGKIVMGGYSYPINNNNCWFTAIRLTQQGQLDSSFATNGKFITKVASSYGNDTVNDMLLQPDDKIVLLADSYIGSSQDIGVIRLTPDGQLDISFSGDGKFNTTMIGTSDYAKAIEMQPDGKILIAGSYSSSPQRNLSLLRLTTNGELDLTFSNDGKANYIVPGNNGVGVGDMKLQSTGQILICGNIFNDYMVARIFSGMEDILDTQNWNLNNIYLFLNPTNETIYFSEDIISVTIFTLEGKKVIEENKQLKKLLVNNLKKGVYIVNVKNTNGNISYHKVIKQ